MDHLAENKCCAGRTTVMSHSRQACKGSEQQGECAARPVAEPGMGTKLQDGLGSPASVMDVPLPQWIVSQLGSGGGCWGRQGIQVRQEKGRPPEVEGGMLQP